MGESVCSWTYCRTEMELKAKSIEIEGIKLYYATFRFNFDLCIAENHKRNILNKKQVGIPIEHADWIAMANCSCCCCWGSTWAIVAIPNALPMRHRNVLKDVRDCIVSRVDSTRLDSTVCVICWQLNGKLKLKSHEKPLKGTTWCVCVLSIAM